MFDNNKYKVGIYLRLSKEDLKEEKLKCDSESIKNQRILLEKYIKENNLTLVDEYVDDGFSGSNFDRPAFIKMLNDIEKRRINMVITKDLSRLGRNNIETNEYIDRYFPMHKVRFVAILDNVDTEVESQGNEMAPFKILMNEYYNRITSKNIRSTFKNKKSSGLFLGFKAPYGYKKSSENKYKLEVDLESSKVVKRIFNLAKEGKSSQKIASILSSENIPPPSVYANLSRKINNNLWCSRTIDEIITNETYIGNLTQGRKRKVYGVKMEVRVPKSEWIIVKNTHEAIIDKATFEIVQKIKKKVLNKENNYLLKKFIYCKECGHAIGVAKKKGRNFSYTACTYYQKYSKFNVCTPHTMNYEKLESGILEKIRMLCTKSVDKNNFENIIKNIKNCNHENIKIMLESLNKKISCYDVYFDDIYLDLKKGKIKEEQYNRAKERLVNEKEEIKLEVNKLKEIIKMDKNCKDGEKKYLKFINDFLSFNSPSRELLALLIDKVEIDKNKNVDIYFSFKL